MRCQPFRTGPRKLVGDVGRAHADDRVRVVEAGDDVSETCGRGENPIDDAVSLPDRAAVAAGERLQEFRAATGHALRHRTMRSVASATCARSRAKQMRKCPSPPGPKAAPGAAPTPASSISRIASARESE